MLTNISILSASSAHVLWKTQWSVTSANNYSALCACMNGTRQIQKSVRMAAKIQIIEYYKTDTWSVTCTRLYSNVMDAKKNTNTLKHYNTRKPAVNPSKNALKAAV